MKIYQDKNYKNEVSKIDFGIVEAGTSKEYIYYVFNDTLATLKQLQFQINHSEINIAEYPSELKPKSGKKIVFIWNPKITLREGLRTEIQISGLEVWV